MGKKKYLKQISSFNRLIDEHLNKIKMEEDKNIPNTKLINYWKKEIDNFRKELIKSEKRLKRGE